MKKPVKETTRLKREIKRLKWQVANWERKEIKKATCCWENQQKAEKLEQAREMIAERLRGTRPSKALDYFDGLKFTLRLLEEKRNP